MSKKKDNNLAPVKKKVNQCPTCGKFLNNDVAALRVQVEVLTTERDRLREELAEQKRQTVKTMEQWEKAKKDANYWRQQHNTLLPAINSLRDTVHWLLSRNLWQRIVNAKPND
jgi:chromosome segregation ATPase